MRTTTEKCDKALRELMIINHDRAEGYLRAATDAKDNDLKVIFTKFANESKVFANQLKDFMGNWQLVPDDEKTKITGKLYRIWMDMKLGLSDNNRKSALSACEFGEDIALKTYDTILADTEDIPDDVIQVIKNQRKTMQEGHDMIRALRDRA